MLIERDAFGAAVVYVVGSVVFGVARALGGAGADAEPA